ncbi:hypothetical protein ABZ869_01455 [Streptomyces sp. NPDC046928]|uniref:hypothetical protein n=1 Tax=Streptomyces sp. NPDC046928 TaxID=3155021 RepID=UPI0033F0F87F
MTESLEETVPAAGTIRRIQALGTVGYPPARLATWIGLTGNRLARLLTADTVPAGEARLVAALYDLLSCTDPARRGIDAASIQRTKERAAAEGWAPVGAWDDDTIDDPAAIAEWTGYCGKARGVDLHQRRGIPMCPPCQAALARRLLRNRTHELRTAGQA